MLISFSNVQAKDLFEYQWPQESGADWFMSFWCLYLSVMYRLKICLSTSGLRKVEQTGLCYRNRSQHISKWNLSKENIQVQFIPKIFRLMSYFLYLNVFPPFTTYFICFSHLFMLLGILYCKQYGSRSDCSKGSSLIRVHNVCSMIKSSLKSTRVFTAGVWKQTFSGQKFGR